MPRKNRNFKAPRARRRPEWPYEFRELLAFLLNPMLWASARKITWSPELEGLRRDVIFWLFHLAGAPTVWPDGTRNALKLEPALRPTAQRVLRAVGIARNADARDPFEVARDLEGPTDRQSFPPLVARIAYRIASALGVPMPRTRKTTLCDDTRAQWAMQTVTQRVINALVQEAEGTNSAVDTLDEDIVKALAQKQHPVADQALRRLRSPAVRTRVVDEVKKLLARSRSPLLTSGYMTWLEEQGYMVQLLSDSMAPISRPVWSARAESFPSAAKERLSLALCQADNALSRRWRICTGCARPFPIAEHAASRCPACRRKSRRPTRLHAADSEDPVIFQVLPEDSPRPLRLCIAEGIRAPASLRRLMDPKA